MENGGSTSFDQSSQPHSNIDSSLPETELKLMGESHQLKSDLLPKMGSTHQFQQFQGSTLI